MRDNNEDKISLDRIFLITKKFIYVKQDSFTFGRFAKLSIDVELSIATTLFFLLILLIEFDESIANYF